MENSLILTLNAGSSSVKFAVFEAGVGGNDLARGQVENVGGDARLDVAMAGAPKKRIELGPADHAGALHAILTTIATLHPGSTIAGVGHRIVHGGVHFIAPAVLGDKIRTELASLIPLAPLHQPHNLAAVEAAIGAFPDAVQVGCFDTAFHQGKPFETEAFGLPRPLYDAGVRRYGFHGLSYTHVSSELARRDPDLAAGRVIIAHLGNGASMCALKGGKSIASTMGFSTLEGLPMGTRCGQIDPGVLFYLMAEEGMNREDLETLLYKESGLKGLSGVSHDMREIEASGTPEAASAISFFTAAIRRHVGALAADLGGLDALIFCGGIGEHSDTVRAQVCRGMDWLGIVADLTRNADHAEDFGAGPVRLMVIPTDEERVIADATSAHIRAHTQQP
ncbi:MAG: acetate/propionate family kinase [Pseudomonadota bacterium]